MRKKLSLLGFLIGGVVVAVIAQPTQAQEQILLDRPVSEVDKPLTEARWLTQAPLPPSEVSKEQVAQVTAVQLKPTEKGLEVFLETVGSFEEVLTSSADNSLITDIPNTQLRLPRSREFRQVNPTKDITSITVTNLDAKTIRVTVTGKAGVPTSEVSQSPQALILSVIAPLTPAQLTPTPAPPSAEPQQPEAPAVPAPAPQAEEKPVDLFLTAEEEAGGYNVPGATTATRTDTPLRDIPQSIQVVPQQVIEDQQARNLNDVLRNAAGVVPAGSSLSGFDNFNIRGFDLLGNILRNGFSDRSNFSDNVGTPSSIANIERVEVLKGPASVLYGQGSLGGTINIITKQPLNEPFYKLEGNIGSYDFYSGSVDLSGPLNDSKTFLYRLNASLQQSDSFVDFVNDDEELIAPVLTWQIGENTKLTLEGEYLNTDLISYQGLPARGTVLSNPSGEVPIDRFIGEPSDFENRRVFRVGYNFEHRFSENWQLRSAFGAAFSRRQYSTTFPVALSEDGRILERGNVASSEDGGIFNNVYNLDTFVVGEFATGPVQHQLVTGFNLFREEFEFDRLTRIPRNPLDLFDPVYDSPTEEDEVFLDNIQTTQGLGVYLQDLITVTDNLKILAGGRFDLANQSLEDRLDPASEVFFQQDAAFSPRVGIVYQPIEPVSLYASYSRSFIQNVGTTVDNQPFEPERGTQFEAGVKADLTDELSATLAFYQLTKLNALTDDPDNLDFQIAIGKQRSRGIGLDIGGEILPGWNLIASYAFTNTRITEDEVFPVGNQFNNVPKHGISFWSTYEIQKGLLQGLGFGLGLFYVDERQGDLENTFTVPAYLRTDAAVFYRRDRLRVALNINNLFNIDYFEAAQDDLRVFPGAPFTVQGTVSWEF